MNNKPYPLYEVEKVNNLKELVDAIAKKYETKPAFLFEQSGETVAISYSQFKSDVDALGTALHEAGIKDMKVGLIGENSYNWILTSLAVSNSGNVIMPLDKELSATDIKNLIDHSGAEVIVYSNSYSNIATSLQEGNANIKHYINMTSLTEWVDKGKSLIANGNNSVVDYVINNDSMSTLSYTSGTTGSPKGVMLSHSNLAHDAVSSSESVCFPDTSLLVLPLHHIAGFMGALCMLMYGSAIGINSSIKTLPSDFQKYQPGITVLVPLFLETFYRQINALAAKSEGRATPEQVAKQLFGSSLSVIICGAAPLDGKYIDEYLKLGITVLNVYGLTESAGTTTINRNEYFRAGSVGQAISCSQITISNPDENGHGEVYTKGGHIMLGYYKNEQATKDTFDGEWFKTGDIGYMDADGFLYISGRKKNVIILNNGKNVYPEEVEFALLKKLPYVKEAVVSANNNEIIAEVFLDTDNSPNCASQLDTDIIELNKILPPYMNINKTVIRDTEFPKTSSKKIKREYN